MEKNDLKDAGLKVTVPRVKILKILENINGKKHLSAESVYNILLNDGENISLATVYRVLTQFEQAGLVARHHFNAENSVFELDQGGHHDHFVCMKCGKVDEFYDGIIEKRQQDIAKKLGYQLTNHSFHLYGFCLQCKRK
ncbi:MAG: Fur family transcriptional regulator, ferric uptake regulator [Methyloprofundus sp.]|nr:MAG: Fur family transcriptional regulator, ferric uptake regulator [Methyloprofundus sp.]